VKGEACEGQVMSQVELVGENIRDITPKKYLDELLNWHQEVFKGNIKRIDGISQSMDDTSISVDIAAIQMIYKEKVTVLYSARLGDRN